MLLVFGASGLLGYNFLLSARLYYQDIIAVYNRHSISLPGIICRQLDLASIVEINTLFKDFRPELVINCAALTNVDWCQEHEAETMLINAKVPGVLASAARFSGSKFVHISTDAVFNGKVGSYSEDDIVDPLNVYAKSKLAGELAVQKEFPESLIVRTNIFGRNIQNKNSLAEWMLSRLTVGEVFPAFNDAIFTPMLANDLSDIILEMVKYGLNGLYNVASCDVCSKYEFALELASIFKLSKDSIKPTSIVDFPFNALRPKNLSLNTDKITRDLGRRMPSFKSGILRFKQLLDADFVTS